MHIGADTMCLYADIWEYVCVHMGIYIYIYLYVCVCLCIRTEGMRVWGLIGPMRLIVGGGGQGRLR